MTAPDQRHGPVCAVNCPHESCLVIACPRLFVTITRDPRYVRKVS